MAKKVPISELRNRIAFLQRNLIRSRLATKEELDTVASRFAKARSKDALWEYWAELKAVAIARAIKRGPRVGLSEESLQAAVEALSDQTCDVTLISINETFTIYPASYKRIEVLEEHAWWVARLEAARTLLIQSANKGSPHYLSQSDEVCSQCNRPLSPGRFNELLQRIQEECEYQRAMLYAQVTITGPAPAKEPVDWAAKITPAEDLLLMEAYHRVNYDVIMRLPEPKSQDNQRSLPRSWAFLFSHQANRERRPSVEVMRDRSLGSVVAVLVMEAIRHESLKKKGKVDAEQFEEEMVG